MAKATKQNEPKVGKTSFNLPTALLNDLRYMVTIDKRTNPQASQTDIVIEALTDFKAKWEKKNGKIPG